MEIQDFIIASDTDSLFIQLKPIMDKIGSNDINDVLKVINKIQLEANQNLDTISKEKFNINNGKHFFELKQEVILDGAYWAGKRRYALHIINKEGVDMEEWDFKGLDIMKSNFPKLFKDFGESLIKQIILKTPKEDLDKQILDFKKSLKEIDWKKMIKPTGIKNLNNYIASKPLKGEIFSKIVKKCPINTRAAIIHNDFIKFKKVDKKYSSFRTGDKMYVAYLKPNPYSVNVIGSNGYNDPPEISEIIEKYLDRDQVFDSTIKNKIESLYSDIGWGMPIFNQNINKFFSFT